MRNIKFNWIVFCLLLLSNHYVQGQNNNEKYPIEEGYSPNPYPLTHFQEDSIMKRSEQIIQNLRKKHRRKNLDKWSKEDRETYLKAKASKILLMKAPDYYREYNANNPKITRILDTHPTIKEWGKKYVFCYELIFYADSKKERLATQNNEMASVKVYAKNGEARGFLIYTLNLGKLFRPPYWEGPIPKHRETDFPYMTGLEPYWKNKLR